MARSKRRVLAASRWAGPSVEQEEEEEHHQAALRQGFQAAIDMPHLCARHQDAQQSPNKRHARNQRNKEARSTSPLMGTHFPQPDPCL